MSCEKQSNRLTRRCPRRPRAAGVTLIELMVTTAIVAVLTAIAYPSYQHYVARVHRNVAAACLSQYSHFMERHYTSNLTYLNAAPALQCRTENSMERRYSFTFSIAADGQTYTVQAIPTTFQEEMDAVECGALTLNQAGGRSPADSACW